MVTDSFVVRIDKDNLVVLVYTVLVDPVRVQYTEVTTTASNTLFSNRAEAPLELEVVHTLADGLAVCRTLRDRLLAVSTAHADTVDHVALLGLVAQAACLVWTRGTRGAVDDVELAVFPATDAQEEAQDVRLLLLVELPDVLVRAHLRRRIIDCQRDSLSDSCHPKVALAIHRLSAFPTIFNTQSVGQRYFMDVYNV